MAQKDYVKRGCKTSNKKKLNQRFSKKTFFSLFLSLLFLLIVYIFFIQNKHTPVFNEITSNKIKQKIDTLPPKPEERWNYIKELEKQNTDLPSFNHSVKSNINNITRLTNEQRQLLNQIDADRRDLGATNLPEISNNDYTSTRSHIIINDSVIKPSTQLKPIVKSQKIRSNEQKIMIKCGSFKNSNQAESIKANLALLGLESIISLSENGYYLLLGPYNKKEETKIRNQIKLVGVSHSIIHINKG
ncbi:MAG: SPOR domain-containing protein [Arsenophonus sp. ET-KM2-MAG3]